jgi:hypothetical protein
MKDLRDLRAERLGITFHSQRALDPFPHAAADGGPLDRLFMLTRPDTPAKVPHPTPTAEALLKTPLPPKALGTAIFQKGMTRYQRKVNPR